MISVAVTGADGYLGTRLCAYFHARGCQVYKLWRIHQPAQQSSQFDIPFFLERQLAPDVLTGIDALVHCAYDFRPRSWREIYEVNVKGSVRLLEAAAASKVRRIIVISSLSAFPGCKSLYGKAKFDIEREALRRGASVLRPGMLFGQNSGGIIGVLNRLTAKTRFLPLVGRGRQMLYGSSVEDLSRLIYLVGTEQITLPQEPVVAASDHRQMFREIIETLSRRHRQTSPVLLPVPWQLIWLGLRVLEVVGLPTPFRSDGVINLVNQNPNLQFNTVRQTGVRFRDFTLENDF